jgi:hypothetical protein
MPSIFRPPSIEKIMVEEQGMITTLDPEERFILKNFDLQRGDRPEIEGLRAAFRYAASTAPFTDRLSAIAGDIPVAAKRLGFIQTHEKLFFENHSAYDRIPMIVTALMGSYADDAESKGNEFVYSNLRRAFTHHTPEKAGLIGEGAVILTEVGAALHENPREEVFCAHLLALESAGMIKENFHVFQEEFHRNYLEYVFPAWKSFADRETELGRNLQAEIAGLVHRIRLKYPSSEIIAFPAPKG